MRFNKRAILDFKTSIDLFGVNYFLLDNLKNKTTQRFLNKFEQYFFFHLRKKRPWTALNRYEHRRVLVLAKKMLRRKKRRKLAKKIELDFNSTKNSLVSFFNKKEIVRPQNFIFKKVNNFWFYNNRLLRHFDYYFANYDKEKYFSMLFFYTRNSNHVPSYSTSLRSSENKLKYFIRSKRFKYVHNVSFLKKFIRKKRSRYFYKLRNIRRSRPPKFLFSIERVKYRPKHSRKFLMKDINRLRISSLKKFFGFNKYNTFFKFFDKVKFKSKIYSLNLLLAFECRLEFCLYRLNFVPNTYFSRQYIRFKKILVNLKPELNCFYVLSVGDLITFNPSIFFYQYFFIKYFLLSKLFFNIIPLYFEIDYTLLAAILIKIPKFYDIKNPYLVKLLSIAYK